MRTPAVSKRGRRSAAVIATLTLSVAMTACGGVGDEKTVAAVAPSSTAAGTTIDMIDLAFEPRAVTVRRGQTVTFRNRGKVTHNAKGKDFFSRVVEPGGSYRHTFNRAGTFSYVCTYHPGMDGRVTVKCPPEHASRSIGSSHCSASRSSSPQASCSSATTTRTATRRPSRPSHPAQSTPFRSATSSKPATITVAIGTKLKFTNNDSAAHTATSGPSPNADGVFDSGTLKKGQSTSVKLTKKGKFAYYCEFHPFMKATVIVK